MRRFSLFEFLSYGDDFWNEAEGVPSGRPACPTCQDGELEKEIRQDGRNDVWRCKNCKNRVADANLNKAASIKIADRNQYWTLEFDENQLEGLFDLMTFAERVGAIDEFADPELVHEIIEELDYVHSEGPEENGKYVLRINGDEWNVFREIYEHIADLEANYPDFLMELMDQNEDLLFEDIKSAERVFALSQPEESSQTGLENIPTMNTNPDGSMPMGNCPQCGVDALDPSVRQCENCGWDQDNACPECFDDNSVFLEEDGTKYCNNCGWKEQSLPPAPQSALGPSTPAAKAMAAGNCPKCGQPTVEHELDSNIMKCPSCGWEDKKPPALSDAAKEVGDLQKQFELPSAEHPLGPHTGAEAMDNQYYVIPIDLNGNEPLAVSVLWEWGHTYKLLPENLMEDEILSKDDQGNVVFSLSGKNYKDMLAVCRTFVEYANKNAQELLKSIMLLNTVQDIIQKFDKTNPEAMVNYVVQLAQDINNFIIKFSSTPPLPSSQANLEKAFNAPSVEHPLGPHTGNTQELYTSGSFVKGSDGRWLVAINPSGGQRDPEPGDWATIQQRSKSFNRPVPLTLVEDLGGAWKFKNGHHPSIESQVEDETL